MTVADEEMLISPAPPLPVHERKRSSRSMPSQPIQIECVAAEQHFINSTPATIHGSLKPIRFSLDPPPKQGRYRSEIVVHNNPNVDLYIKRLRVGYSTYDSSTMPTSNNERTSSRTYSAHSPSQQRRYQQQGKGRSASLPRSGSQALLHQWIDDICSNEKLMADDDICFFLKNGEFLARI